MNLTLLFPALVALLIGIGATASAQSYPVKPIRLVVGFVAGGEVDMSFPSLTAALPLMGAKKIRALAVTSAARTPLAPGLPTVSESGLPGYEHMGWYGMFAPAAVPKDIVARLNAGVASAMNAPEMRGVLAKDGFEPKVNSPEQFAAFMRSEIAQNAKLIRASGGT